jgi:hypothetical protein
MPKAAEKRIILVVKIFKQYLSAPERKNPVKCEYCSQNDNREDKTKRKIP